MDTATAPKALPSKVATVKEILAWLAEKKEAADTNIARYQGSEHEGHWRGQSALCREALKQFGH